MVRSSSRVGDSFNPDRRTSVWEPKVSAHLCWCFRVTIVCSSPGPPVFKYAMSRRKPDLYASWVVAYLLGNLTSSNMVEPTWVYCSFMPALISLVSENGISIHCRFSSLSRAFRGPRCVRMRVITLVVPIGGRKGWWRSQYSCDTRYIDFPVPNCCLRSNPSGTNSSRSKPSGGQRTWASESFMIECRSLAPLSLKLLTLMKIRSRSVLM